MGVQYVCDGCGANSNVFPFNGIPEGWGNVDASPRNADLFCKDCIAAIEIAMRAAIEVRRKKA